MTNDAIHVASCKFYNIGDIATNDKDIANRWIYDSV